ncbi:MAG: YcxB family protein [Spirochaetia bacterium]|nr:YcxB family protein [Spirochaetia bacterium]
MNKPLILDFKLTEKEINSALNLHSFKKHPVKSNLLFIGSFFITMAILMVKIFFSSYQLYIEIFMFPVVLFLMGVYHKLYAGKILYKRQPNLQNNIMFKINDDGIKISSFSAKAFVAWDKFTDYIITDKYILLYNIDKSFYIVPKDNPAINEDVFNSFAGLVKNKVILS